MKKMFAVMIISLITLSVAFAQDSKNDPVTQISTLGVMPGYPPSGDDGGYWNNFLITRYYSTASATGPELVDFLHQKKNLEACVKKFGSTFRLLAIEPIHITEIWVKNGVPGNYVFLDPNDKSSYWVDSIHFLLKEKK